MSKNLKGKSYNEVMNEWAAQRSFLQRSGSGLMRPGHGVTGVSRILGWIWRIALITLVPLLAYLGILRMYGRSEAFTAQLREGTRNYLNSGDVVVGGTQWDLNGDLRVSSVKIKGSPANFFHEAKIENISSWIPMPQVFRAGWHLKTVEASHATLTLRSGGTAIKTAAAGTNGEPRLLTAGWGIKPDFGVLEIDRYKTDHLTLSWGSTPSTTGGLADANAVLTRQTGGWDFAVTGGTFRQGWLDNLRVNSAKVTVDAQRAVIEKGDFTIPGGGSGTLSGTITLGESPELNASVTLEGMLLQTFLPASFRNYVKAIGRGTVTVTGSPHRASGILMDTRLDLQSGTISGIPVFRALEIATGESYLAQPEISGGRVHFTFKSTQEDGGLVVDADEVILDCGATLKVGLTVRHERKQEMAANAREAAARKGGDDGLSISTTGTLRIGLPPETIAKMTPAIRQEFFTRQEGGFHWMELPYNMEAGQFTRQAADRIITLHGNTGH